jgi:hypothetical protein
VGPRASLDAAEKRKFLTQSELELRPPGRPARNQLLCRLRYAVSLQKCNNKIIHILLQAEDSQQVHSFHEANLLSVLELDTSIIAVTCLVLRL